MQSTTQPSFLRDMSLTIVALVTLSPMLAGTALAAGSHAGGHGHDSERPAIGAPGEASAVDRTVEITMTDNAYAPEAIEVHAGETIRFVVRNEGAAVHEFNIATPAMHEGHRGEMMTMFQEGIIGGGEIDREKMHAMGMSHDHANSVLLEPGEEETVVWRFPDATNLEFACNVPGHYESGMVGRFRFQHHGG
jgi:uncharacterized cupredoxin-like copper-binding protein